MTDRLTVAAPVALMPTVAEIVVAQGIADAPGDLPGPTCEGHGSLYVVMSGLEGEGRIAALLQATQEAGLPLVVLTEAEDSPEPEAGAILALRGPSGLAALDRMGLTRVISDEV